MNAKRAAFALLVVGLLLLPGPAYAYGLYALSGPHAQRSSVGYQATPVDLSNDTLLADHYAGHLAFQPSDFDYAYVRADYAAPNRTRRLLEVAIANGSAAARNDTVAHDLRRLARNDSFLTEHYETYDAFSLTSNDTTITLRTHPANDSELAAAVREHMVVAYANLTPAERQTFREIRKATTHPGRHDYRPWLSEPLPPARIVTRNGTAYDVHVTTNVDAIPVLGAFFLGLYASAAGVILLLAAGALALYASLRG